MKQSNDEGCGVQKKSEMKQTNRTQGEYKVNLGCGAQVVDGWVNVDYSIGARLSRIPLFAALNRRIGFFNVKWDKHILIHDLRKPLPFKSNSVYVVYSSHTLEHLNREDGHRLLRECYRVLRPGGIVRIVVPDLRHIVDRYINKEIRADRFCEELRVFRGQRGKNSIHKFLLRQIAFPHQCMYDQETLLSLITKIGFQAEAKSQFDSAIAGTDPIEIESRSDSSSVIVEGVKS